MKFADCGKLAGSVILAGFDGHELPADISQAAQRGALGGIVLFSRNVDNPKQVAELIDELRAQTPRASEPVVAIDQEGGRVVRIREPLTVLPPARTLGKIDDPGLTRSAGRLVGLELRALGFTLNFAPVLDVDTNTESSVIGDRSYGITPDSVIRHGLNFAQGLLEGGVCPCGKHFPGHGGAALDSHVSLPRVELDVERIEAVELAPFRAWCREELGPLMTAHVVYPALDDRRPATVSRAILTTVLRQGIGFGGVVLSDDLEMGAIGETGGAATAALEALLAGVDGLLVCRSKAIRAAVCENLQRAAVDDPQIAKRLEQAANRVRSLSIQSAAEPDYRWIGSPHHSRLQSELRDSLRG